MKPAIIGTNSIICQNNELLLGIGNSTALSGIPGATLINPFWEGPDGTGTGLNFTAATPGVYSLTMRDSYNGCMKTGTVLVGGSIPAFGLQGTAPTSSNSCNGSIYVAHPNITGYTISATSGSVNGDNISNLCYGWVKVCMTFTNSGCYKCDSLLMNGATSIAENEMNDRFEVYPNPSTGNVNVKFPGVVEGVISLMDMKGKEVQSVVSTGSTTLLEIKDLSPGIYFIELTTEKRTFRKKLVILEP